MAAPGLVSGMVLVMSLRSKWNPTFLSSLCEVGHVGLPGLAVGRVNFWATFSMFCGLVIKETALFAAPPKPDMVAMIPGT